MFDNLILAVLAGVFLLGTTITMNKWMYGTMTSELAKYMGRIYVQQGGSSYPPIDSSLNNEVANTILSRSDLGLNTDESAPMVFIRVERGMMPFLPGVLHEWNRWKQCCMNRRNPL